MFESLKRFAHSTNNIEVYNQTLSAFSNRLPTAYNIEGIAFRDAVESQSLRRYIEQLNKRGIFEGITINSPARNPGPHEAFFYNEHDFRIGLSLGTLMWAYCMEPELVPGARDTIDSYPATMFDSIQPNIAEMMEHEKAHLAHFEDINGVTNRFGIRFEHNILTKQPHFFGSVIPFGKIPIETYKRSLGAPHNPSEGDHHKLRALTF